MTKLLKCAIWGLIAFLGFILLSQANAATVWNVQAGKYYKYDVTPNNLLDSAYKYIVTTDFEAVNPAWTKLNSTWIKYTTVTGGIKYAEEVIIAQPPAPACEAFLCVDDFGLTIDLTKNTVLTCPMVKITKEQMAQIYEGLQSGATKCR